MKKQKNRDIPRFKLNQTRVLAEMKLTLQKRKKLPKLTYRDNKIYIIVQPQITRQGHTSFFITPNYPVLLPFLQFLL